MCHFAMTIAFHLGSRKQHGVIERSVIQLVGEHRVAAPDQSLYRTEIGKVAGGEKQSNRLVHKSRKFIFELLMYREVTTHQMRCTTTHAILLCALLQGGDQSRVIGEAEIIVAAE